MYNLVTYLAYLLAALNSPHTYFHRMSRLDLLDRLGLPLDQMPRCPLSLHQWLQLLLPGLLGLLDPLDPLHLLDPLDPLHLLDLLGLFFLSRLADLESHKHKDLFRSKDFSLVSLAFQISLSYNYHIPSRHPYTHHTSFLFGSGLSNELDMSFRIVYIFSWNHPPSIVFIIPWKGVCTLLFLSRSIEKTLRSMHKVLHLLEFYCHFDIFSNHTIFNICWTDRFF
jgi:hypothetical protein